MDQKLHEKRDFLMIFDGGLTMVWSKMLRLYWHARHSMSNYRSNLKKNQSFDTRGHRWKVPEWIKNCVSTRKNREYAHQDARQAGVEVFVQIRSIRIPFYFAK